LRLCIMVRSGDGVGCSRRLGRSRSAKGLIRPRACIGSPKGLVRRRFADRVVLFGFSLGL
jgi:hypothetical protein